MAYEFVEYLAAFKIAGVGFSGGEPLLTLDCTIQYLEKVKKRFGHGVHAWMYTNGLLLTEDKLKRLKDAGLDEIRFDIVADQYRLDKVTMAVGRIANVTIEIPAVPEDRSILCDAMKRMDELGVNFLNLHQLRVTPHNRTNLCQRPYTFLHGPKATVLESELTALEMLQFASDQCLKIGVNYCSFIFRDRYQAMGAHSRAAGVARKPHESITGNGYLRTLTIVGEPCELSKLVAAFAEHHHLPGLWSLNTSKTRLSIHECLLPLVGQSQFNVQAAYHTAAVKSSITYQNSYKEVRLGKVRKIVVERRAASKDILLDEQALKYIRDGLAHGSQMAGSQAMQDILPYETPGSDLMDYF